MTLARAEIGGRNATVAYLTDAFEPVEPAAATLVKVVFDDGEVTFARPRVSKVAKADDTLERMYARARALKPQFDAKVRTVAQRSGSPYEPILADLKDPARTAEKARTEKDGDLSRIKDIVRATVIVDEAEQALAAIEVARELFGELHDFRDALTDPDTQPVTSYGYRDIRFVVRDGDGTPAELQITVPELIACRFSFGDALYHEWRTLAAKGEAMTADERKHLADIEADQRDLYEAAWEDYLRRRGKLTKYSPDQPRDDHGRWTDEGGGSGGSATPTVSHEHVKAQLVEAYAKARDFKPHFDAGVEAIAKDAGTSHPAIIPPLKGEARAAEKAITEKQGDVSQVKDIVRATVLVDSPDQALKVIDAAKQRFGTLYNLRDGITDHNPPRTPAGYRDINFNVRAPNGTWAEVQVNVPEMQQAKDGDGHRLYEQARVIEAKGAGMSASERAQLTQLNNQMSALYSSAWEKVLARARKSAGSMSVEYRNEVNGNGRPSGTSHAVQVLSGVQDTGMPSELANRVPSGKLERSIGQSMPTGTNCFNCRFISADMQTVEPGELNAQGGLDAPDAKHLALAKQGDLVTLPGEGHPTVKAMCRNPKIDQFVTARMCCAYWDAEGTLREWTDKSIATRMVGGRRCAAAFYKGDWRPCPEREAEFVEVTFADGAMAVLLPSALVNPDSVAKFDPDEPRDERGRWTAGGSAGAAHELHQRLESSGGFTYQPMTGDTPKEGYALSILPGNEQVMEHGEVTEQSIQAYLDKHADLFKDPNTYLGGWLDVDSGKVYLDVSVVEKDHDKAVSLARAHNQEGIYDLGRGQTEIVKPESERRKMAMSEKDEQSPLAGGKSKLVRFHFRRGATAKEIADEINRLRAEHQAKARAERTQPDKGDTQ